MKKQIYNLEEGQYVLNDNSKSRDILVTHVDLDGAGCAVIALLCGITEIYYCGNGKDIDDCVINLINEYKNCYYDKFSITIADNSVSYKVAKELNELSFNSNFSIKLLDHHASAKNLDKFPWATIDTIGNNCGTTLMYNEFSECLHNGYDEDTMSLIYKFCNNVRDRDLWLWEKNGNTEANVHNEYLYMLGIERYAAEITNNLMEGEYAINPSERERINERIAVKNDYVKANTNKYFLSPVNIHGRTYMVAFSFANMYISEVGNAIAKSSSEIDICAIVCPHRGEYGSIELRAVKDDVDLSVIAKELGGGGHKHAAGFPMTEDGLIDRIIMMLSDSISTID